MLVQIIVPFLVCVIGTLIYALASNAKVSEIGRIAYGTGMLVSLFVAAAHVARLP